MRFLPKYSLQPIAKNIFFMAPPESPGGAEPERKPNFWNEAIKKLTRALDQASSQELQLFLTVALAHIQSLPPTEPNGKPHTSIIILACTEPEDIFESLSEILIARMEAMNDPSQSAFFETDLYLYQHDRSAFYRKIFREWCTSETTVVIVLEIISRLQKKGKL